MPGNRNRFIEASSAGQPDLDSASEWGEWQGKFLDTVLGTREPFTQQHRLPLSVGIIALRDNVYDSTFAPAPFDPVTRLDYFLRGESDSAVVEKEGFGHKPGSVSVWRTVLKGKVTKHYAPEAAHEYIGNVTEAYLAGDSMADIYLPYLREGVEPPPRTPAALEALEVPPDLPAPAIPEPLYRPRTYLQRINMLDLATGGLDQNISLEDWLTARRLMMQRAVSRGVVGRREAETIIKSLESPDSTFGEGELEAALMPLHERFQDQTLAPALRSTESRLAYDAVGTYLYPSTSDTPEDNDRSLDGIARRLGEQYPDESIDRLSVGKLVYGGLSELWQLNYSGEPV